jgi:hypothetical protein
MSKAVDKSLAQIKRTLARHRRSLKASWARYEQNPTLLNAHRLQQVCLKMANEDEDCTRPCARSADWWSNRRKHGMLHYRTAAGLRLSSMTRLCRVSARSGASRSPVACRLTSVPEATAFIKSCPVRLNSQWLPEHREIPDTRSQG